MPATRLLCILILFISSSAYAIPLAPKIEQVCTKGSSASVVDPRKLVGALFMTQGVHDFDLDTSGGDVGFAAKVQALTNWPSFCPGKCSDQGETKLSRAAAALIAFFRENARAVAPGQSGFQVVPANGIDSSSATLAAYLKGEDKTYRIICVSTAEPPVTAKSEAQKKFDQVVSSVRVRNNVADLAVSRSDKKFAGLQGATASYENNFVKGTQTISTTGVVGYKFEGGILGDYSSIIPYLSYAAKNVRPGTSGNASSIGNVATGLLGDFDFVVGSYHQNIQLSGQILHSYITDTDLATTNVVFAPDFFFPGVGQSYTPAGSPVSFLLRPQAKLVYGRVVTAGSNPNFATNDFARGGGRIELAVFGEWDSLKDFSYNTSYEFLKVWVGAFSSVTRWENTLSYVFPDQDNWSIQLKYVDGRNLDTFEREKLVTLGIGFKN